MSDLLRVKPARAEDLEMLTKLSEADGHACIAPTHIVFKGNQVIGHLSIGAIPMVLVWMDTQRARGRDSLTMLNIVENLVSASGAGALALPCVESSPFTPFLKPLGYLDGKAKLFLKGL